MSDHDYAAGVRDLIRQYDLEKVGTVQELEDVRSVFARRITEEVIRETTELVQRAQRDTLVKALADAEWRGHVRGVREGLKMSEFVTGQDMTVAIDAWDKTAAADV